MRKRPPAPRGAGRNPRTLQNGHAIKEFRLLREWSITYLAGAVGVSQSALSRIEKETRSASEEVVTSIATALGIDVEAIRRERGEPHLQQARDPVVGAA